MRSHLSIACIAFTISFAAISVANAQPHISVSASQAAHQATSADPRVGTEARVAKGQPDIPHTFSYQGVLRGANGTVVSDGEYSITARLYSDADGKSLVWQGTYLAKVESGVFNLTLGGGEYPLPPLSAMDMPLWVSIQVGDTPEMREFAPLSAAPYSLNVADSSITSQKISTDYVKSISVNGQKLSGQGREVNIMTGDGILASIDPATSSILLKSNGPALSTQKGAAPQGNTVITGTLTVTQSTFLNVTTGQTWLGSSSNGVRGTLNFFPSSGNYYTGFQAPSSMAANVTYTLPSSQGTSGTVLTDDGSGGLSWTAPASSCWGLTGNSGTTYGTNFIGTSDAHDLQIRVRNTQAGVIEGGGTLNTGLGYAVLSSNTTGYYNAAIGDRVLASNTTGNGNTGSGAFALYSNTTGIYNAASGYQSLNQNTTGVGNTASGTLALNSNTGGIYNTASGAYSLGTNVTGVANTAMGFGADVSVDGLTNATAIGYDAMVGASNSLILGSINGVNSANADVNVGIGTTTPSQKLEIKSGNLLLSNAGTAGQLQLQGTGSGISTFKAGAQGSTTINYTLPTAQGAANTVLTDNGSGILSWAAPPSGWSLTGNAGTTYGTNFIGTTDARNLQFRVNNQPSGMIEFNGYQNTGVGYEVLYSNTTGYWNTANGNTALYSNTTGAGNTASGMGALYNNTTGAENTAIGYQALDVNTTGWDNTAIGVNSLLSNASGSNNTALGVDANVSSGDLTFATAIGAHAIVSESNALVLGSLYDYGLGIPDTKVGIGTTAPSQKLDIKNGNLLLSNAGGTAGQLQLQGTGSGISTFKAGAQGATTINYTLPTAQGAANTVLTDDGSGNLSWAAGGGGGSGWGLTGNAGTTYGTNFIGTTDGQSLLFKVNGQTSGMIEFNGNQNTGLGYQVLINATGVHNTASGYQALYSNTDGFENTANGHAALYSNETGAGNTAIGVAALYSNTGGAYNTASGEDALYYNTTGSDNTASGLWALLHNTTGNSNTASGDAALEANTTGSSNTAFGLWALNLNTTGDGNTASGLRALQHNVTGSYNTAVGIFADVSVDGLTKATAIGYNAKVGASNCLVLGGTGGDAVKVGIGTTVPAQQLDVVGNVQFSGALMPNALPGTTGEVLTSQGAGSPPIWAAGGSGWGLSGNAGTTYGTNFIGTTDAQSLQFRVNNQPSGMIGFDGNQNTGMGYQVLFSNTTGAGNTASGGNALFNNTSGVGNTASGKYALLHNTTGDGNTASGAFSLATNVTGFANTALGFSADVSVDGLTNATAIGYNAKVGASNCLVLGGTGGDVVKVGIGTTVPTQQLDVVGNVQFSGALMPAGSTGTANQVLTSTGAGGAPVWRTPSTLGSGAFILSYTTVISGTSLTGSVLLPYGYAVVDVQDDGTSAPATLTLPSGAPNGQVLMVTTEDTQGLMISSSSFSLIEPTRSVRFVWSGGVSGSWKRETP